MAEIVFKLNTPLSVFRPVEKKLAELQSDLNVKLSVIDWEACRSLSGPEMVGRALEAL